jgi:hypothetical protein
MNMGDILTVSGCITKEKFIAGRTLADIERILGFRQGRFIGGIAVVALLELPGMQQFELAGYSQVATHHHQTPSGLDIDKIKANAMATWSTVGFERLVKVRPAQGHDPNMNPDTQYPPGLGVPQWIATVPLQGRVVGMVADYPNGRYLAADAARR